MSKSKSGIQSSNNGLLVSEPVSLLNKRAKIDIKKGFVSLASTLISVGTGDVKGAAKAFLSTFGAIGIADDPQAAAWTLIYKAYIRALSDVFEEYGDELIATADTEPDHDMIADVMRHNLNEIDLRLESDFFDNPVKIEFIDAMEPVIELWLKAYNTKPEIISAIEKRVRQRFVFGLHDEWRENSSQYTIILEKLKSPFLKSTAKEQEWERYKSWLVDQTEKRMFNEAFGLADVFVPLRAYYFKKEKDEEDKEIIELNNSIIAKSKKIRHVIDLEEEITKWAKNFTKDDNIKVLSGGPGSGKSSCGRMLACKIIETQPNLPVLFIPLHHFDISSDLVSAMKDYISKDRFLTGNPLQSPEGEDRILVIFDGLDELSMRGSAGSDAARNFVDMVIDLSHQQNGQGLQRQYLITGREVAIQAGTKRLLREGHILHLLPYLFKIADNDEGKKNLLEVDQRDIWWKKYGAANGKNYPKMPNQLKIKDLDDITKEPLLNYLVALSFERGEIDFDKSTTLNEIYDDMLSAVYSRQYEAQRHAGIGDLESEQFRRILEEIALTVWHGNGRKATVKEIEDNCLNSGLGKHLKSFQSKSGGVSKLLAAFYFRKSTEKQIGDESFEFTHKSFGEFLTAKRITRLIKRIVVERQRNEEEPDSGWSVKESLEKWIVACGPTEMDHYILKFLKREILRSDHDTLKTHKIIFERLLEEVINNGSPIEKMSFHDFREIRRQLRNAEETLLILLNTIAEEIKETIALNFNKPVAFGSWLKEIQGQRNDSSNRLIQSHLSYLNLSNQCLDMADLFKANLQYSELTNLELAIATQANLKGAFMNNASLHKIELKDADLTGANLERANLEGANLEGADLEGADLERAILPNTNLQGANLQGANLEGAYLKEANLKRADLRRANLKRADLEGADLEGADLEGVNLKGANLKRADLRRANLKGADLKGADLEGADLEGADLEGARPEKLVSNFIEKL